MITAPKSSRLVLLKDLLNQRILRHKIRRNPSSKYDRWFCQLRSLNLAMTVVHGRHILLRIGTSSVCYAESPFRLYGESTAYPNSREVS